MDGTVRLVRVIMPEKGVFAVRCPQEGIIKKGCHVVVNLGYGPDVGTVLGTEFYDPAVHGPSLPGYQMLRMKTEADDREIEAAVPVVARMKAEFLAIAQRTDQSVRLLHVRLSLGRQRLFVWYAADTRSCDLSAAAKELERCENVRVLTRQLTPRDEVAVLGALGPCGRPCCCATWQTRPPHGLTSERMRNREMGSIQPNGICGRYKCCFAFEE